MPAGASPSWLPFDTRKLLFSSSSFIAASAALWISFAANLPRPWWALLTVYVTAQPLSGPMRPKILHRLTGIAAGAAVSVLLVPNLENAPELLVVCLAVWTGLCIYLAVLDRTPRAYLFQMAAFSSAVIGFPYLDDPGNIFIQAISRAEEMTVAIVCVTIVHALLQPWSAAPVIQLRAAGFLDDAARWTADMLNNRHGALEQDHRRKLAADITDLGLIATHLPFDMRGLPATRRLVHRLQERIATILPVASAAENRLALLRRQGALDSDLVLLLEAISQWLLAPADPSAPDNKQRAEALASICRERSLALARDGNWSGLLTASLYDRLAELMAAHQDGRRLQLLLEAQAAGEPIRGLGKPPVRRPLLARDHGLAALAGCATATAIALYCSVWIGLAWPNGSATAAFAALITCSFATQDDPAPVIGRYLGATLLTFPIAALYLFVILPAVDGWGMLVVMLSPVLLGFGYLQALPSQAGRALPMLSCLIVALGFTDRFQADFAVFLNTGIAQVGGIVTTLAVTRLFRSASACWTARRIIRGNWRELARLADLDQPPAGMGWTGRAVDRLGQLAARMVTTDPGAASDPADGLDDLRIGRNLIRLRRALRLMPDARCEPVHRVFREIATLFRARFQTGQAVPPSPCLLASLDEALDQLARQSGAGRQSALLALVGLRCNLFPDQESGPMPVPA